MINLETLAKATMAAYEVRLRLRGQDLSKLPPAANGRFTQAERDVVFSLLAFCSESWTDPLVANRFMSIKTQPKKMRTIAAIPKDTEFWERRIDLVTKNNRPPSLQYSVRHLGSAYLDDSQFEHWMQRLQADEFGTPPNDWVFGNRVETGDWAFRIGTRQLEPQDLLHNRQVGNAFFDSTIANFGKIDQQLSREIPGLEGVQRRQEVMEICREALEKIRQLDKGKSVNS